LPGDAGDAFQEVLATPLDQPVSVHDHDVAGVEGCLAFGVAGVFDDVKRRIRGGRGQILDRQTCSLSEADCIRVLPDKLSGRPPTGPNSPCAGTTSVVQLTPMA
jgi:hypothetical protein